MRFINWVRNWDEGDRAFATFVAVILGLILAITVPLGIYSWRQGSLAARGELELTSAEQRQLQFEHRQLRKQLDRIESLLTGPERVVRRTPWRSKVEDVPNEHTPPGTMTFGGPSG